MFAVETRQVHIGPIRVPFLDGQIIKRLDRGEALTLERQRVLVVDRDIILVDDQEVNLQDLPGKRYPERGDRFIAIMAPPFATFRN